MGNGKKLSSEDVIRNISKNRMTPFSKLGHSYVAIRQLVDFMQVLEKNEKDYKDEINIRVFEDLGIHQSDILSHYIILEAFNFFETLKHLKKYNKSLPNLPSYSDKLTKVRNKGLELFLTFIISSKLILSIIGYIITSKTIATGIETL